MGLYSSKTFGLFAVVLLLTTRIPAFAQKPDPPAQTQPQPTPLDAMQAALARQQASIDAFRESVQSGSMRRQLDAVSAHAPSLAPLQPMSDWPHPEPAPAPQTSSTPAAPAASPSFFTAPWPGSLALAMPAVQLASDCAPLPSSRVSALISTAATKHQLDSNLLRSVMKQESAFKPCAISSAGAMGLMQIMPETAETLKLDDPFDPDKNVDAGAKFLKMMLDRFGGDRTLALAAYNAGPGAVDKAGGLPPIAETLQYVSNILGELPIAY